jgi:hypothetical protein
MEAARTSETLVNFYQTTRCYNPEDSNLHTRRRENLKSYSGDTQQGSIQNKRSAITVTLIIGRDVATPDCTQRALYSISRNTPSCYQANGPGFKSQSH